MTWLLLFLTLKLELKSGKCPQAKKVFADEPLVACVVVRYTLGLAKPLLAQGS